MKIVSLVGSNRGEKCTSASLVNYLAQRLAEHGVAVASHCAIDMYGQPHRLDAFLNNLKESKLLIISAPIYVDLLPSPVIHVLEEVRDRVGPKGLEGRKLLAIIHSGYPEPQQRRPALGMCRCFAREVGMEWWGGLSFGGTSPISGQPLEAMGGMTKGIRSVLDQTAEKVVNGGLGEVEALVLQDRSTIPVPAWMVRLIINAKIRKDSRKGGIKDLRVRPLKVP